MIITFEHFLLAVSHNMDVLDANELEFNVGVVVFIFVAFSCSSVSNCIQLQRHLINRQNTLFTIIFKKCMILHKCYVILIMAQRAHGQDVFKAFAVSTCSWQNAVWKIKPT